MQTDDDVYNSVKRRVYFSFIIISIAFGVMMLSIFSPMPEPSLMLNEEEREQYEVKKEKMEFIQDVMFKMMIGSFIVSSMLGSYVYIKIFGLPKFKKDYGTKDSHYS